MHRSSSAPRGFSASGDAIFFYSSLKPPLPWSRSRSLRPSCSDTDLPTFDPHSRAAQKERLRNRAAENAVHVIPLLLLVCVTLLWIFSYPDN